MKRAGYRDGIEWLAYNDDTSWVEDDYVSVSASMLADLFGVDKERVRRDVRRALKQRELAMKLVQRQNQITKQQRSINNRHED